jgi:hypothetical protein
MKSKNLANYPGYGINLMNDFLLDKFAKNIPISREI